MAGEGGKRVSCTLNPTYLGWGATLQPNVLFPQKNEPRNCEGEGQQQEGAPCPS